MWIIRVKRVKVQVWNGGNKLPTLTIEKFWGREGRGEEREICLQKNLVSSWKLIKLCNIVQSNNLFRATE